MPTTASSASDRRVRLLNVAVRVLEESGPEALSARALTAEIGASTQAIYTHFGGMPELFEAVVGVGFEQLTDHVESMPETDDPVADHFVKGSAYVGWALTHPQLYRFMYGIAPKGLRARAGLKLTTDGAFANFPEGHAAAQALVHSLTRVRHAGRIHADPVVAARQFLSATHGWLLLESSGVFGPRGQGISVIAELSKNLMVAFGDSRDAAERSLRRAADLVAHQPWVQGSNQAKERAG